MKVRGTATVTYAYFVNYIFPFRKRLRIFRSRIKWPVLTMKLMSSRNSAI